MANKGLFSSISVRKPKRTSFDLSYSNKLSLGFGELCPMLMEKNLPSDKFYIRDEFMCRFAPFYGQVFQAFKLRTEYFFVPSRLLWKNFQMFLSGGLDGQQSYIHPYVDLKVIWQQMEAKNETTCINTILDYFNLPTYRPDYDQIGDDFHIDALPFYAYCKAFLDYYADENLEYMGIVAMFDAGLEYAVDGDNTWRVIWLLYALQGYVNDVNGVLSWSLWKDAYNAGNAEWPVDTNGRPCSVSNIFKPLRRSYPKDYFTSALPFAQRGPIVQIPLNGSGDVVVTGTGNGIRRTTYMGVGVKVPEAIYGSETEVTLYEYGTNLGVAADSNYINDQGSTAVSSGGFVSQFNGVADNVTDAVASIGRNSANAYPITFKAVNVNGTATITDLRTAQVVQAWLEKRARTGSRPKETIYASFGVKTKDYRLDRTEFLSGFSSTVKIGEVFTTSQDDTGSFVPGLGVSVGQLADGSRRWKQFYEEHGYTFGNVSLYPVAAYFQGVPRQFLELDMYDYVWPELQHIGEQSIYNCELMIDDTSNTNFDAFGYQLRNAQYKSRTDQIHGDFRNSLEYMVDARKFTSQPSLSNSFVQINPALNNLYRVFNATGEWADAKPAYVDIYHHFKAVRPLTYYSNPRLI